MKLMVYSKRMCMSQELRQEDRERAGVADCMQGQDSAVVRCAWDRAKVVSATPQAWWRPCLQNLFLVSINCSNCGAWTSQVPEVDS